MKVCNYVKGFTWVNDSCVNLNGVEFVFDVDDWWTDDDGVWWLNHGDDDWLVDDDDDGLWWLNLYVMVDDFTRCPVLRILRLMTYVWFLNIMFYLWWCYLCLRKFQVTS